MNVTRVEISRAIDMGLLKPLAGSFAFTGTQSLKRDELGKLIQYLGGTVQTSVTKTTSYLVVPNGEGFRKGSKFNAALSHGVPVITEGEFCSLILPSLEELLG